MQLLHDQGSMAATGSKKKGKKKGVTLNLSEFLAVTDNKAKGSWADDSEDIANVSNTYYDTNDYGQQQAPVVSRMSLPTAPRSAQPIDIDESKLPDKPPYTVYLGNIPFDCSEEDITSFLKQCKVSNVRFPKDEGGRVKGFCYAEVDDMDSLRQALGQNNQNLRNRRVKVDLATQDGHGKEHGSKFDRTSDDWRKQDESDGPDWGRRDDRGGGRDFNRGPDRDDNRDWRDKPGENEEAEQKGGYDDRRGVYNRRGGGFEDRRSDDRRGGGGYDNRRRGYEDRRGGGFEDRRGGGGFEDRRGGGGFEDRSDASDDWRGGQVDSKGGSDDRYRRGYGDRGYEDSRSNDRGFGRDRAYNDRRYNDRGYNDRGSNDRGQDDRGGFDRGGRGRSFGSGFRDQDGGPRRSEDDRIVQEAEGEGSHIQSDSQEAPKERKRLVLQKRTQPVDPNPAPSTKSNIFGSAKPVDTAAKEREIEARLQRERAAHEQERQKQEIDREMVVTRKERPERVRTESETSVDSRDGRRRHSSSGSGRSGPRPILMRRESERSNEDDTFSSKEDILTSPRSPPPTTSPTSKEPTSPKSPKPAKDEPPRVVMPAPPPKENAWARKSETVTSPTSPTPRSPPPVAQQQSPSSPDSQKENAPPHEKKDRGGKPEVGRQGGKYEGERRDAPSGRGRHDSGRGSGKAGRRDDKRPDDKGRRDKEHPREMPKYEEPKAPVWSQPNRFSGLDTDDIPSD